MTNKYRIPFPLATRTSSSYSVDMTNKTNKGAHVLINIEAIEALNSLRFVIEGKDMASGSYYSIIETTLLSSIGLKTLSIYPSFDLIDHKSSNNSLPMVFRVRAIHLNDSEATYSVSINMLR